VILSRFIIISAVFLSLGSLTPAFAEDSKSSPDRDVLWFDQSFKIMTCDLKTTDSKCIGNPVSPLCAIETVLATGIFSGEDGNDHRLRSVASGKAPGPVKNLKAASDCAVREGYRVYATKHFLRLIDVPYPQVNMFHIKKGDVAINIQVVVGCENRKCPPPGLIDPSNDLSYLLRKGKYGWYIIPVAMETGIDTRGTDFTNRDDIRGPCPEKPGGWTGPGPLPGYCPEPLQNN